MKSTIARQTALTCNSASVRVEWPIVKDRAGIFGRAAGDVWSPQAGCLRLPVPSLAVLRLTGARLFDCRLIFAARLVFAVPSSLFDDLACLT